MSFAVALRSVGARRAPLANTRSIHALNTPFGAPAPRPTPTSLHAEAYEPAARLNVVANPVVDKFRGVPLGAYQVATPFYEGSADAQTGTRTATQTEQAGRK